jgi:lipopolysaccharide transport system ATP-binding protein
MSDTVIKVENISKLYRLGEVGTGTISHDLNRWWAKVRGKEDPFIKLGESNDRRVKGTSDYAWALKDINFEVSQGEVLGIMGKNGAGKSTLLKVLSKVTQPTSGHIKVKGRIASLLEVGTGFHPELTGRENIFLNGAILGMTRAEIRKKFDEIVDFSGIERYIDTPVKRYSSGMYVRLAFGVAAYLEPEILIVDEVLAVGDAEFQKKALGKMKSVSTEEGRTVLFVSHNMPTMQALCNRAILLNDGYIQADGCTEKIIHEYLSKDTIEIDTFNELGEITGRTGSGKVRFSRFYFLNKDHQKVSCPISGAKLIVRLYFDAKKGQVYNNCRIGIAIKNTDGLSIVLSTEMVLNNSVSINEGTCLDFEIEKFPLTKGEYIMTLFLECNSEIEDWLNDVFTFSVEDGNFYGTPKLYPAGYAGKTVLIDFKVNVLKYD